MIALGDCNGCSGCANGGGVICDLIAFSNEVNGMPATPGEIVGSTTEGNDIVFWVNRYPSCFRYAGAPTEYETNEGHPATDIIPENQYFFDAGARAFWQNQAGTMVSVPTPSWFKVGSVTGKVTITIPTCACSAHMITSTADVNFTFADGDDAPVQVNLTTTCPGPPVFWGCQDQPGGGEFATLELRNVAASGGCVSTGTSARGLVTCTHALPHASWGDWPYSVKRWEAVIKKPIGFLPFDWDGVTFPVDRYLSATKQNVYSGVTTNGETKWADNSVFPTSGNPYPFYEHLRYDGAASTASGGPIVGASSPDYYFIDHGGGDTTTQTLADISGTLESGYVLPDSEINALLSEAETNDTSGTLGIYGINQADIEYVFKLLASAYLVEFADPAFDSSKTYAYTGTALPDSPFNPDDWTETAATGFNYAQELSGTPDLTPTYRGAFGNNIFSAYFGKVYDSGNGITGASSSKITIDASNSMVGNPEPARVFVTVSNYEDLALVSTEAEVEITDSTFDISVASLGGATFLREKRFEIRLEYINAPFCGPSPNPVFVCHPGLTSDPCP